MARASADLWRCKKRLVAIESYLRRDHAADLREGKRRLKVVADALSAIPTVKTQVVVPPWNVQGDPQLRIQWDQAKISLADVIKKLRDGDPPIETWPFSREDLVVNLWMAEPGETEIVAHRTRDILTTAMG